MTAAITATLSICIATPILGLLMLRFALGMWPWQSFWDRKP